LFNIPNIITLTRLGLLPVVIIAIRFDWTIIALVLYAFGCISDFLDGYLARKLNQESEFGRFLDPIADKIFIAALFLVLVDVDVLSGIWIVLAIVILVREFLISGLREYLGPKNITLPVSKLAKWKTTVQMIAVGLLIATPLGTFYNVLGLITLTIAAFLTVVTAKDYIEAGLKHMKS